MGQPGLKTRLAVLFAAVALFGPAPGGEAGPPPSILLATTTSTQDSGLLDSLVPLFERQAGYTVKTVAVGTGAALKLGAQGEADVVLVHAPALELAYAREGTLIDRRLVMHNDFVLVGPPADPAGVRGLRAAAEAFRRIAAARATFVSRGDNSGTHIKEKALWKAAGVAPARGWYVESGQGMGATLILASEKLAHTLSDRGTYLAFAKRVELAILVEGDRPLLNVYHVMRPDPARFPRVNAAGGKAFADFMVAPATQDLIRTFGVAKYGSPLFFPDAGQPEPPA